MLIEYLPVGWVPVNILRQRIYATKLSLEGIEYSFQQTSFYNVYLLSGLARQSSSCSPGIAEAHPGRFTSPTPQQPGHSHWGRHTGPRPLAPQIYLYYSNSAASSWQSRRPCLGFMPGSPEACVKKAVEPWPCPEKRLSTTPPTWRHRCPSGHTEPNSGSTAALSVSYLVAS